MKLSEYFEKLQVEVSSPGTWIWKSDRRVIDGKDWICSECGTSQYCMTKYCPECGAKMEKEDWGED